MISGCEKSCLVSRPAAENNHVLSPGRPGSRNKNHVLSPPSRPREKEIMTCLLAAGRASNETGHNSFHEKSVRTDFWYRPLIPGTHFPVNSAKRFRQSRKRILTDAYAYRIYYRIYYRNYYRIHYRIYYRIYYRNYYRIYYRMYYRKYYRNCLCWDISSNSRLFHACEKESLNYLNLF